MTRDSKGRFVKGHTPKYKGKKGVFKWSEEAKERQSRLLKGRTSNALGYKWTKEQRERRSREYKGKFVGPDSPAWKGGITKDKKSYMRICNLRRRTLESKIEPLSKKTLQLVYEDNIKKHGTLTCVYCREILEFGNDSLDHKTPLVLGGNNDYDNLCISCRLCNSKKGRKTYEEYIEKIGAK